jgi:serine/threonine protein kinase
LTGKLDVFSFGLVLYEILTDSPVFPPSEPLRPVMKAIVGGHMPPIPARCGSFMQDFIPRCWSRDPEMRPSFADILHEFEQARFAVVPNSDSEAVGAYTMGVVAWERGNRD